MAPSEVPSRLLTLAEHPNTVQHMVDLSAHLDRVQRVHLLRTDGAASRDVDRITREHTELLISLSRHAEITVLDTGTSMVHPSTSAALHHTDHMVIAAAAEPPAPQITTEGAAEPGVDAAINHRIIATRDTHRGLPAHDAVSREESLDAPRHSGVAAAAGRAVNQHSCLVSCTVESFYNW